MPIKPEERICNNCGFVYVAKEKVQKYCSYKCFIIKKEEDNKKAPLKRNYQREYSTWMNMKNRCYSIKNKDYHHYGGRGIKVCNRWLGKNGFKNFLSDMGKKPTSKHSLDRFPNKNGNYTPKNCRWATQDQQTRNTRRNHWIKHNGKRMILADWARYFGVWPGSLLVSIKRHSFAYMYEFYRNKNKVA